MQARFVVMANGPLNRPKLPGIPGIETFKGHSFHTSRWDYDYTGGDSDGRPDRARGQAGRRSSAPARRPSSACRTSAAAREAALRLPAHALVRRRARQPADRSGLGRQPGARLAEAADGELQHPGLRRLRRTRTWSATAGPTSSATCSIAAVRRRQAGDAGRRSGRADGDGRLPQDEPGPRPGGRRWSRTRRPPRR